MSQRAVAALLTIAVCGCHARRPLAPVEEAPYQLTDAGFLRVREDLIPTLRFAKVERDDITAEITGVGTIEFAGGAMTALRVPFDGISESVVVAPGQAVTENQVLATIRSSELAKMRADVRRLTSELGGEYDAVRRADVLVEKEAISNRKVIELQAKIGSLEAQRRGIQIALRSARTTEDGEDLFELRSPRTGQVIQRQLAPGERVHSPENQPAFIIADPTNLVVQASFPERDAPLLKEGFTCRIEIPSLGDARLEGKVRSVVQAINPTTRTVHAMCRFDSPDPRLRAEMLARITVAIKGNAKLVVPREAVLLRRDSRVVLVRHGERELERRPVIVGANIDFKLQIISGLQDEEEVIVEGAVLLDGELDRLL